jgi:hypothetical protein
MMVGLTKLAPVKIDIPDNFEKGYHNPSRRAGVYHENLGKFSGFPELTRF